MTRPLIPGSSDYTFSLASDPRVNLLSSATVIHPAQFQRPNGSQPHQSLNGSASPAAIDAVLRNDPLAGMTPWQIYQRCIWISDEETNTKISLLCLSRFMDKDLRAASMSYAQWARDCGFSEPTAKRCAKAAADAWLKIGVGKGRYVPGKGHENRYDGTIPQKWADELRRRMLAGVAVRPDETILRAADEAMAGRTGVSDRYPEQGGVSEGHPETPISGYQADTGVSEKSERGITQTHVLLDDDEEDHPPRARESGELLQLWHGVSISVEQRDLFNRLTNEWGIRSGELDANRDRFGRRLSGIDRNITDASLKTLLGIHGRHGPEVLSQAFNEAMVAAQAKRAQQIAGTDPGKRGAFSSYFSKVLKSAVEEAAASAIRLAGEAERQAVKTTREVAAAKRQLGALDGAIARNAEARETRPTGKPRASMEDIMNAAFKKKGD